MYAVQCESPVIVAERQAAHVDQRHHQPPTLSTAARNATGASELITKNAASLTRKCGWASVWNCPRNPRANIARWISSARAYERAKRAARALAAARNRIFELREAAAILMIRASSEITNK